LNAVNSHEVAGLLTKYNGVHEAPPPDTDRLGRVKLMSIYGSEINGTNYLNCCKLAWFWKDLTGYRVGFCWQHLVQRGAWEQNLFH